MDASIKAQWLKALRSGEYKQGQCALRYTTGPGEMEYCCLGVLMDVLIKRDLLPPWEVEFEGSRFFGVPAKGGIETAALSSEACRLTGLTPTAHLVGIDQTLTGLNDRQGKTFLEIADVIEEWL